MAAEVNGRLVNRGELARTLGVSLPTIDAWRAKGCPFVGAGGRGKEWTFDTAAVFAWRSNFIVSEAVASYQGKDGQVSKDEADRRRAVALAIVAEIEADTALRGVVSRTDAEGCMADFCQALKTGLDNAAHKVAGRATTLTSPHEILDLCHAEFNRSFRAAQEELDHLWGLAAEGKPGDGAESDPDEPGA